VLLVTQTSGRKGNPDLVSIATVFEIERQDSGIHIPIRAGHICIKRHLLGSCISSDGHNRYSMTPDETLIEMHKGRTESSPNPNQPGW